MDARVKTAINLMRQLVDDQFSMRTLSKSVNLSPTRLRQLFQRETDQSPMQYLRELRMKRAEHLLLTTFLTIKEVAGISGIRDVSHFVRDFKKQYGLTPSEFRSRHEPSPKWSVLGARTGE
jgi:transcriptional regulator GlxA family with amidase domain